MTRPVWALAALVVLLAGCSGGEEAGYDREFRRELVDECVAAYGGQAGEQVCGCWYDSLADAVPFDELPDTEDLVGNDFETAPSRLPGSEMDVPMQALARCIRNLGAVPTIGTAPVPPTLPRPPTTPTTATTVVG